MTRAFPWFGRFRGLRMFLYQSCDMHIRRCLPHSTPTYCTVRGRGGGSELQVKRLICPFSRLELFKENNMGNRFDEDLTALEHIHEQNKSV